jgi:hypothetical protein
VDLGRHGAWGIGHSLGETGETRIRSQRTEIGGQQVKWSICLLVKMVMSGLNDEVTI